MHRNSTRYFWNLPGELNACVTHVTLYLLVQKENNGFISISWELNITRQCMEPPYLHTYIMKHFEEISFNNFFWLFTECLFCFLKYVVQQFLPALCHSTTIRYTLLSFFFHTLHCPSWFYPRSQVHHRMESG